ncbi:hypothetical protein LY474_24980 [Myxococcus stipitatus]|uniref:hypothetical protein n=1 Tax=Myxococcus stipitatus TaxID=83455 RepID=UPI001F3353FF|nr:hypothetical protein [Myxococcus stipitatus]MCE9671070.1 hypothetical protein [Myxococcus stipitatus]
MGTLGGLLLTLNVAVAAPPGPTPTPSGKPVAIVLGREIRREELLPPEQTRKTEPPSSTPADREAVELMNLQRRLLQPLLKKYVEQKKLEPTKKELQDCTAAFVAMDERNKAENAKIPKADAASSERICQGFVVAWKVQRALHRQYGGDIIFQQAGPEAVGAYPGFLEERQKAGDFQILDPDLSRRFWERIRKGPGIRVEQDALETPWWLKKPDSKR